MYQIRRKASYADCDINTNMSIQAYMEALEDCFSEMNLEENCDNLTLDHKYNAMWVFTKSKFTIYKHIKWAEEYVATCKMIKNTRILSYTLTEFRNSEGELCATALLEACVISKLNSRFVKLVDIGLEEIKYDEDIDLTINEIEADKVGSFDVSLSLIDYSKHLNNTKSISKYIDTLSVEEYTSIFNKPYELIIHYTSQAYLHDVVDLYVKNECNNHYFEVRKDTKPVVKCLIK